MWLFFNGKTSAESQRVSLLLMTGSFVTLEMLFYNFVNMMVVWYQSSDKTNVPFYVNRTNERAALTKSLFLVSSFFRGGMETRCTCQRGQSASAILVAFI